MRRAFRFGCYGFILSVGFGAVQADEWRSARHEPTAPAEETPADSSNRVKLGRPVRLGKPIAKRKAEADPDGGVVQTTYAQPTLSAPQKRQTVIRGQSPESRTSRAAPGAEESFNCGVVTEGPPAHESVFANTHHWLHHLITPWNWFGGDSACGNSCGTTSAAFASDHAFDSFVSPVSNPFFFEDPRALTELRIVGLYQNVPGSAGGGHVEFFGLQGRLALNDRWSIVMPKLGFVSLNGAGIDGNGLSEVMIGPKYTFWRDDATNTVAAVGLNVELPVGSGGAFQDTGSLALSPYITAGQKVGNFHLLGTAGYRFSLDSDRSDMLFVSGHVDYSIFDRIYPLAELNWYHYMKDGNNAATAGFEGQDLVNFGSTNVTGNDVVTLAAGVRFKITETIQAGIVGEIPLSNRQDLNDWRITADIIFRY